MQMDEIGDPWFPDRQRELLPALQQKDAALYGRLKHNIPSQFWRKWKKVYPEDFPQGEQTPATGDAVVPKLQGRGA